MFLFRRCSLFLFVASLVFLASFASAQSVGNAGTVQGKVLDPTGAVIPGAAVQIQNPVTGYKRAAASDNAGAYIFRNLPPNAYHVSVQIKGFGSQSRDVDVHTTVPIEADFTLKPAGVDEVVDVEAGDLLENVPTAHTDVDTSAVARIPMASGASQLSNIITLSSPGVVADANGFFHPLGDHAQTTFTVDNQPISDQQSRLYSNQVPADAIQSFELISGTPQAEYGDKTSLVAVVNTKSGLGLTQPTGSITAGYGSFGSPSSSITFGVGGKKWGNYLSVTGERSGRFLDTPEFQPLHAVGNNESFFDRIDFQPREADSFHLNLFAARSWFQTPNTIDQQLSGQDQRQQIQSFDVAPAWTHLFTPSTLLTVNAYVRQDLVNYYPSNDPLNDQPETVGQHRKLLNTGIRTDLSWVKGHHTIKTGVQLSRTYLNEHFNFGITDPTNNPVCFDSSGDPVTTPTPTDPAACTGLGFTANPDLNQALVPFDLTRGGNLFVFNADNVIDQQAAYVQDNMSFGGWTFLAGLRYDNYRGLSQGYQFEPRLGASYRIKKTNTVLRAGYARTFETPYNENLLLSSSGGIGAIFATTVVAPPPPGTRDQFNVGFQQAFGRYLVIDGDYFRKYTTNAYDFNVLGDTNLAFPIAWRKSDLNGFSLRITVPDFHGFRSNTVLGHNNAIFYNPETGGLFFDTNTPIGKFRIDHDQKFQQTTNVQYEFEKKSGAWAGLTWRYDSGLVAGSVPDFATALTLTPDQQAAIQVFCGNQVATIFNPITSCSDPNHGAKLLNIPADGTEDDVKNPPRIAPRHLFDVGLGVDNIFRAERYKWSAKFTVVNLTNKVALYNFLSTFSGTHFVTPRAYTAEIGFHF